ncbi:MAG: hypothetical protein HYV02_05335 [Deltaproteobacteria bacterium]|nr:hypothetical protein [Deltaproteobacteria bacterium]
MIQDGDLLQLDPVALLARDRVAAEKVWNRFSLEQQVAYLLAAPIEVRSTLCELSHQARVLVEALPAQELWLTVQTVGGTDALALFHLASVAQVQFCLDVDCWAKDRWLAEPTFEWLRLIAAGGIDRIVRFFQEQDIVLIGLLLKQWVTIFLRTSPDEEVSEAVPWPRPEPPTTLDGVLYFQVADVRIDQWLRPMLEIYGKADHEGFVHLCKAVLGLGASEQEEEAFEVRGRRMAEYGFPPLDEAIGVYHRLREGELTVCPPRKAFSPEALRAPLHFALAHLERETLFLRKVFGMLDPGLREACGLELARMANRIVIADGHQVAIGTLQVALRKAIGYLNLALEQVSHGDAQHAAQLVAQHWLTHLFQVGFHLVMAVAERARRWVAAHPLAERPDDPATDVAIGLERIRAAGWRWPKYYVGPHAVDGVLHRDFQCCRELDAVNVLMDA